MKQETNLVKEFRPVLAFLLKFGVTYFVLSLLYATYIKSFNNQETPQIDPASVFVIDQTVGSLKILGYSASGETDRAGTYGNILVDAKVAVSFFEGCNGIAVMILFVAFLLAFNGNVKNLLWFIPAGILAIHLFNILRLTALVLISIKVPNQFYFAHKYLFTAVIYAFVVALWVVWVKYFSFKPKTSKK